MQKITGGYTFHSGAGEVDLYWIIELKAIDKGLINKNKVVSESAWGSTRNHFI